MAYKFNPFTGNFDIVEAGAGAAGSVAGTNTQIQFNDNGSFGASNDFTWNDSSKHFTVNGDVYIPDKIIHLGDTDTAIRFPENDVVAIETAGTEYVRVNGSGAIGLSGSNFGTSGQVLTSQGSGSPVQWASLPSGLAVTSSTVTASGTGNTFGSLPSGLRRVNLTFNGLSTSLGVRIGVRIGGSGGLVATGYNLASCFFGVGYNGFFNTNDSLFGATGWADASNIYNGKVEITRHSSAATTTNVIYFLQLTMNLSGFNYIHMVQGHVTLPTELTQVRMMPESGNFDAGTIEIDYLS
jgi:hypothetical protein